MRFIDPPSDYLSAYDKVLDHGVVQLDTGRWCAVITARVKSPGYDIPPTEDFRRSFDTEELANSWMNERVEQINGTEERLAAPKESASAAALRVTRSAMGKRWRKRRGDE